MYMRYTVILFDRLLTVATDAGEMWARLRVRGG